MPRAEVPFNRKLSWRSSVGFLDTRFTSPAIAPPPYRVDDDPLITSTCCRSSGAICNRPSPPEKPEYNGKPSLIIWVYFPSSPWIRILELPLVAEVCWVCMPVLSRSEEQRLNSSH